MLHNRVCTVDERLQHEKLGRKRDFCGAEIFNNLSRTHFSLDFSIFFPYIRGGFEHGRELGSSAPEYTVLGDDLTVKFTGYSSLVY